MSYILNIETATTVCSVSVSHNATVLFSKELDAGFTHAENLHLFIEQVLKECSLAARDLNAIAVSKGPGSYTGLRIGVSTAKGLAYALNIPLLSVDTLKIMANNAFSRKKEKAFYCPMIDARRMEVYSSVFDAQLNTLVPTEALIVDENSIEKFRAYSKIYFFGDGMPKCKELLGRMENAAFIEDIFPSSVYMADLAHKKFLSNAFEDTAYFEPFYLKDFLILKKKTGI